MKLTGLSSLLLLCGAFAAQAAPQDPLFAWNDTAAKQAITQWVADATDQQKATFIPEDKRFVVFDNDGTLWPEAPLTFQLQFAIDEIKRLVPDHPEWKKEPVVAAVLNDDLKALTRMGEKGLVQLVALTHSGMTTTEFAKRVNNWVSSKKDPRYGCHYNQLGYLPMKQLLTYLRENGFKTWIVSGGGADFIRELAEPMYGIPPQQVVGSFAQGEFTLTEDGSAIRKTMTGAYYDDGKAKPAAIHLFMGQRPVAAFGNSDGDVPMLQYTSTNPDYRTFGLLVHHTDAKREYAYDSHPPASGKLVDGLAQAKARGWVVVDMKSDWNQVFDPALCPNVP
ncbi:MULTISPECIES: HAD family hydrolase [Aeromonas]|uniref:phosphoserine phosphatase n=1 Tax=Aeromonas enteropelogenes TaxID=29489 RepID=A0A175VKF4_AEREN|nr:HAD family hydrolase [Aeromonas enteropelogenes]KXU80452.1 haloacid dehalogenase [Aeromonas enteropelogenes]